MTLNIQGNRPALRNYIAEYSAIQGTIFSYAGHLRLDTGVYIVKHSAVQALDTATHGIKCLGLRQELRQDIRDFGSIYGGYTDAL
jgi:hypothetical protein